MCKYCECKKSKISPFLSCRGEEIVDTRYTACHIEYDEDIGTYTIYAAGDDEGWSEPISFCPFCGRKLNDTIDKHLNM